uniref:Putative secreted protein n=1 Tax=Anopheles darlingi TaxID=43151 RepID=A0A2M4DK28_ANODA
MPSSVRVSALLTSASSRNASWCCSKREPRSVPSTNNRSIVSTTTWSLNGRRIPRRTSNAGSVQCRMMKTRSKRSSKPKYGSEKR